MLVVPVLAVLGMQRPEVRTSPSLPREAPGLREGVTQREKVWRDRRGSRDRQEEQGIILMTSAFQAQVMAL